MTGRRPAPAVRWEMDHDSAADLIHVLVTLEDFVRLASCEVIDELAAFSLARPLDADAWGRWLADYLGGQVLALRAATRTADPTHTCPTGEPT